MDRSLGAVIACFQEIEIACRELKEKPGADRQRAGEIEEISRRFLAAPSPSRAREIHRQLEQMEAAIAASPDSLFKTPVVVDGVRTSLRGLCSELSEVLEDLD